MKIILSMVFMFALFFRFIYFPDNIYFGFDQARDAFISSDIYKNLDFKIIGPSTAAENLFHGPLYWYLIGPLYLIGNGNPMLPSAFLLVLNASGVFLIYLIGHSLFNRKVGVIASLVYAVSFEQTQYAMYFGNPSAAVLTVMMFYGGLAAAIFKKNWVGIPIAILGLGLSVQFEFFFIYLFLVLAVFSLIFYSETILLLSRKTIIWSALCLLISTFTFVLAEIKFDFRTLNALLDIALADGGNGGVMQSANIYWSKLTQHINDNLLSGNTAVTNILLITLLGIAIYFVVALKATGRKIIFLLLWFLSSVFLFIFGTPNLYYSNLGISPALILLASFIGWKIYSKYKLMGIFLLVLVLFNNLTFVVNNKGGITSGIYVQEGMLLSREKMIVDYIYQKSGGKPIVVSALTMPLKINTTWAYLFNWYGKDKYGYVPYWSGEAAVGYPGSLPVWKSEEEEYIMFNIVEPTRGIRPAFVEQFLIEQEQYGKVTEEVRFGKGEQTSLVVQMRGKNE